jgi:hypothetical protein
MWRWWQIITNISEEVPSPPEDGGSTFLWNLVVIYQAAEELWTSTVSAVSLKETPVGVYSLKSECQYISTLIVSESSNSFLTTTQFVFAGLITLFSREAQDTILKICYILSTIHLFIVVVVVVVVGVFCWEPHMNYWGAHGSVVGWGTMPQAGRLQVQFQMR